MFIYAVKIEGVRSSMACMIELCQSLWPCGSEALAYGEDYCHDTSARNVYIFCLRRDREAESDRATVRAVARMQL